jgi:hypothetical protein
MDLKKIDLEPQQGIIIWGYDDQLWTGSTRQRPGFIPSTMRCEYDRQSRRPERCRYLKHVDMGMSLLLAKRRHES